MTINLTEKIQLNYKKLAEIAANVQKAKEEANALPKKGA